MMKRLTFDFNKEIFLGEIGALAGAPLVSFIVSRFTNVLTIISFSGVAGATLGAGIFWVLMRAYDKNTRKELSLKNLASDISYFTPGAFILALLASAGLFFISRHLLNQDSGVLSSVAFSQLITFIFFLIGINIYRYFILKYFGKKL